MNAFLRFSGMAAIAGGVLRIANIFTPAMLSQGTLALSYLVTDVLLLLGIAGFWVVRRATLGLAGTIGIAVFIAGILAVRASAFGIGTYVIGALLALIGLAVFSVEALIVRKGALWAPLLWLTALVALGGALTGNSTLWAMLSATAFGLGFAAAGVETLRR